jgi:exonuclease III
LLLCGDFNIARTEADLARPSENTGHIMFIMLIRPDQGTLAGAWTTFLYRLGFVAS